MLIDTDFKEQRRLESTESGLFNLREWTIEHKCEVVACESTSDFWVPICTIMEGHVTVIVGNARDIKMLTQSYNKLEWELFFITANILERISLTVNLVIPVIPKNTIY